MRTLQNGHPAFSCVTHLVKYADRQEARLHSFERVELYKHQHEE